MKPLFLAALTLLAAGSASAQLATYCFEGSAYTCFGLEVTTVPHAEGTEVTVRLANRQGVSAPGGNASVPWARVYAVELRADSVAFGGGPLVHPDTSVSLVPSIALEGAAEAVGDTLDRWFLYDISSGDGAFRGYRLETFVEHYGADLIGCTLPPQEGYPYFRTCRADGEGAVDFTFLTTGTWNAADAAIAVAVDDPFAQVDPSGDPMTCLIAGTLYDDPDVYHCAPSTAGVTLAATALDPLTVAPGGSARFRYTITNTLANPRTGSLYFTASGGNKGVIRSGTIPAGGTIGPLTFTQRVPLGTPPGVYNYVVNVGQYPNFSVAHVPFQLTVAAQRVTGTEGGVQPVVEPWSVTEASPWPVSEETIALIAEGLPESAVLGTAPNPFTDQLSISYTLPKADAVRLAVYDVLGREVVVLVDDELEAGTHAAIFHSRGLTNGVYLVRMETGLLAQTRRVVLLR